MFPQLSAGFGEMYINTYINTYTYIYKYKYIHIHIIMLREKPYISLLLNSFNKEWVLNCVTWFSGISENDDIIFHSYVFLVLKSKLKTYPFEPGGDKR